MIYQGTLASPIGPVQILASEHGITSIKFKEPNSELTKSNAHITAAIEQLSQYFEGKRQSFELSLSPEGTIFRQQAWQALTQIPYGETRSYSEQAQLIGKPKAVRAIGAANGANPISIVIPCHRVIGKSGKLTGYAGGLDKKAWLLELEQKYLSRG